MSIYQDSAAELAALVSQAAGTTVTAAQMTFTTPTVVIGGESTKNTKLWAICNADAPVKGRKVVFYDRLNLADLSHFGFEPLSIDAGVSVYTVLDVIRDSIGITLTAADLEETTTVEDEDENVSVLLKAKATSLGYTGEYIFVAKPWPHISTVFSSDQLIGF